MSHLDIKCLNVQFAGRELIWYINMVTDGAAAYYRWGTGYKLKSIENHCKGHSEYVGIALDEPGRLEKEMDLNNLKELRAMYNYLPAYWAKLKKMQARLAEPMKAIGKSVFDLEKRFAFEEERK